MHEVTLSIPTAPPFRLDLTAWVLRRRAKNIIDRWDGHSYSRVIVVSDTPTLLTVNQTGTPELPELSAKLQSHKQLSSAQQSEARATVQAMLGLEAAVRPFYFLVTQSPLLEQLARRFRGVRPPRFPTIFEALVNAISCQQVSLDVGILLLNRLTQTYGLPFHDGRDVNSAFPGPEKLLDVAEGSLKQLGFSYQKARAIKELAFKVVDEDIRLETFDHSSNEEALALLQTIRGIGRWSAEYVLLRGLGRLDVFPGDDVGGQNNVQGLFRLEARPDYEQLKELAAAWYPYAGFVYFHLLLNKLDEKGLV